MASIWVVFHQTTKDIHTITCTRKESAKRVLRRIARDIGRRWGFKSKEINERFIRCIYEITRYKESLEMHRVRMTPNSST